MASIHVIYDPKNKVKSPPHDDVKRLGLSVASLSIPDELDDDQVKDFARRAAEMVLEVSAPAPYRDAIADAAAIEKAIDDGGGQASDTAGILRKLEEAGFKIVPK